VISVTCDRETAISRLAARDGMTRSQADARLRAQMDADRKAGASDYVIDNSGSLDETRRQVVALARVLLEKRLPIASPARRNGFPNAFATPRK